MGLKPGDNLVIPLCHGHHMEQHSIGEVPFWRKYTAEDDHLLMICVKALAQLGYVTQNEGKKVK